MGGFEDTGNGNFYGDLSVIAPEHIMQLVSYASLSGRLQLTTASNSAVLFVENGGLVFGYLENNPMRIGQKLVLEKSIRIEHLQECLERHQDGSSRSRIGQILVEKGYLQQDVLEKAIRDQVKAIFFEVLSWKEGSFAFSVIDISGITDIFLQERMDHLILQGVVLLDEQG